MVVLVLQASVCTNRIGLCGFTVGEHQSAGETREGLITFRTFPFSLPTQVMRMCFCACGCMCTVCSSANVLCSKFSRSVIPLEEKKIIYIFYPNPPTVPFLLDIPTVKDLGTFCVLPSCFLRSPVAVQE